MFVKEILAEFKRYAFEETAIIPLLTTTLEFSHSYLPSRGGENILFIPHEEHFLTSKIIVQSLYYKHHISVQVSVTLGCIEFNSEG